VGNRQRHRLLRLTAAASVAVLVPLAASRYADHRIDEGLEPAWTAALGEDLTVGSLSASLTGAVRVEDVRVGNVFRARAIVAAVGLDNLLAGRVAADEIRVVGPQIRDRLHRGQESRIAAMLARLEARRDSQPSPGQTGNDRRLRRIIVNDGQLRIDLFDGGRVVADRVELVPTRHGLRVVTGALALTATTPDLAASGQFDRAAADVRLPDLAFSRVLAIGGRLRLTGPDGADTGTSAFDDIVAAVGTDRHRVALIRGHAASAGEAAQFQVALDTDGVAIVRLVETPLAGLAGLAPAGLDLTSAIATGTVTATTTADGIDATGDLRFEGATLQRDTLSDAPLPVNTAVRGRVRFSTPSGDIQLDGVTIEPETGVPAGENGSVHPVELEISGTARFADAAVPDRADLRLALRRTRCMHALLAVPAPARSRLAGLELRGHVEANATLAFDRESPDDVALDVSVDLSDCTAAREAEGANPRDLLRPFVHERADGARVELGAGRPGYLTFSAIPPVVASAFVAAEDARFYEHSGFDQRQIRNSLAVNLSRGQLLRGGSTISQQLVKNVFLSRERTLARKLEEAVITWRLEQRLSKQQILERYLNIVELAPGVYGVADGARHWFKKPLARLQPREVAFLAALTPAPTTLSKQIAAAGKVDEAMRHRVDTVLRAMAREGAIRPTVLARELKLPVRPSL